MEYRRFYVNCSHHFSDVDACILYKDPRRCLLKTRWASIFSDFRSIWLIGVVASARFPVKDEGPDRNRHGPQIL